MLMAVTITAGLGTAAAAPARSSTQPSACDGAGVLAARASAVPRAADAILCLVNRARRAHRLRPVRLSPELQHAALSHSRDMRRRQYFDHVTPEGGLLEQRVADAGYLRGIVGGWNVGEALAWDPGALATPAGLVQTMLDSPPHRRILLDRRYREAGIGLVRGLPVPDDTGSGATLTVNLGVRTMGRR